MARKRKSTHQAWYKLPSETAKAWGAFQAFLALGPMRTHAKLARLRTTATPGVSSEKVWAVKHDWEHRAAAYDHEIIAQAIKHEAKARKANLAKIHSEAQRSIETLIEIRDDPEAPPQTRVQAADRILQLAGYVPPKRVEVTRYDGGKLGEQKQALSELTAAQLEAFDAQLMTAH